MAMCIQACQTEARTYDEGDRSLHVGGEGERTERDVCALPGEREEDGAKGLAHTRQEGRPGGMEHQPLLQHSQCEQRETVVRVQGGQQRPVGKHTVYMVCV